VIAKYLAWHPFHDDVRMTLAFEGAIDLRHRYGSVLCHELDSVCFSKAIAPILDDESVDKGYSEAVKDKRAKAVLACHKGQCST